MIKEINKTLNESLQTLQEVIDIIEHNSIILEENSLMLCESAEGFLGTLVAKLNAGKELDPNDNATRNMFSVLAALDLMRYPQARKIIDSNSVRAYLNIINGVETATPLNQIEVKLCNSLENMKNDEGKSGMDIRAGYLELAKSNPKMLLASINKLRSQYGQITGKLKTAVNTTPQPATQNKPVATPQPVTQNKPTTAPNTIPAPQPA
jgi:hypothetical protein